MLRRLAGRLWHWDVLAAFLACAFAFGLLGFLLGTHLLTVEWAKKGALLAAKAAIATATVRGALKVGGWVKANLP